MTAHTPRIHRARRHFIAVKSTLFLAMAFLTTLSVSAGIVWDADRGWYITEGTIIVGTGLETHEERLNALSILTEARRDQDKGSEYFALRGYQKIYENYQGSLLSAEALYQSGTIYLNRRNFQDAFAHFDILVRHHPEFPRFDEVIATQFRIATAIKNGERPRLWGWLPWFTDNSSGLDFFERVNRNAPYGNLADKALYDKGILALEIDKVEHAIDAFERIIHNYPDSKYAPDAHFDLAKAYESTIPGHEWDQGATRNALNCYMDFISRYPNHPRAPEALANVEKMRETLAKSRFDLALFYYEYRNNARAAAIFFNESINAAPDSKVAADARKHLRLIHEGRLAPRSFMDWVFGRYPVTPDSSYVDIPPPNDLDSMGFFTPQTTVRPAPAPPPPARPLPLLPPPRN
ncbi:MAG: tetratricopeptide repeat protein [Puniceicoccales bacterium]|nr:tetratricopeptide repeat protein [Puniceicoccales bacterium]